MSERRRQAGALLTISQAAAELGVHPNTLRKWVDDEAVPAVILPSGYRRFTLEQLETIKRDMGYTPSTDDGRAGASAS